MGRVLRETFPKVDADAWVAIKNPSACASVDLDIRDLKKIPNENRTQPDDPEEVDDPEDWAAALREVMAGLVIEHHIPDAAEWDSDEPTWLSGTITADMLRHNVPKPIYRWIEKQYVEAVRPQ